VGLSRITITKGLRERDEEPLAPGRVRRAGAGRPMVELADPELPARLEALVEAGTCGDHGGWRREQRVSPSAVEG
jgi:hypothetical protein